MNTDNNLENGLGSETLGAAQTPVNNEPINNMGDASFSPFQDLNNAPLNVPTENADVQPTPIVQTEPLNVQPTLYQPEPIEQPAVVSAEPVMDTINPAPVEEPVAPSFETSQTAPVMDTYQEPVAPVAETIPASEPVTPVEPEVASVDVAEPTTIETPVNEGPTLPIPDQMPSTDYQAGVSTPVDYATPMSDFDQIGTTPELDPKAKSKKSNKGALVILLILLIVALGAGSYYAINVLGIFNKDSVTLKEVTSEKGEELSKNIDDYATFSNTSSTNCVLDTSKVVISTAGTYDFTVTCGEKSYTGKVTIKDTKGPEIEAKTNIIAAGISLLPEMLVNTADEEATYAYDGETTSQEYQTAGIKNIKLIATDASGNSSTHIIPVVVTAYEYSMGIIAKKDVTIDSATAKITEKNVILFNNSAGTVNDTSYSAFVIEFASAAAYKNATMNYDGSGNLIYENFSGTPVFYKSKNTLVLVKNIDSTLIKENYIETYKNITAMGSYQTFLADQSGTNKTLLNFEEV